jgi:hypothetical protein
MLLEVRPTSVPDEPQAEVVCAGDGPLTGVVALAVPPEDGLLSGPLGTAIAPPD